jgi:hypothetical protein
VLGGQVDGQLQEGEILGRQWRTHPNRLSAFALGG